MSCPALTDGDFRSCSRTTPTRPSPTVAEPAAGGDRRAQPLRRSAAAHHSGRRVSAGRHVARAALRRRRRPPPVSVAVVDGADRAHAPATVGLVLATGIVDLAAAGRADRPPRHQRERPTSCRRLGRGLRGRLVRRLRAARFSGGGFVRANDAPVTGTSFTIDGLPNARTALHGRPGARRGRQRRRSLERGLGIPHLVIGWANLQWPPTMTHTISTINRTETPTARSGSMA